MKGLEISENVLEQFRTVLAKLFGIMPDGYDKNRNQNVKHACSNKMPRWSNSSLLLCTPGGGGGGQTKFASGLNNGLLLYYIAPFFISANQRALTAALKTNFPLTLTASAMFSNSPPERTARWRHKQLKEENNNNSQQGRTGVEFTRVREASL